MYIDNENFEKWMEKLSKKLTEIGQDLKSLINTDTVFDENERLLDNQDLAFLLKASFRTLQRYNDTCNKHFLFNAYYQVLICSYFYKKVITVPNSSRKTIFTTISIDKETVALVEKICKRYSQKKRKL